jgi:hypothetical protein
VLEAVDGDIGQLAQAAWKADPNAVVAVVSDHGFVSTDKEVNLNSFMIASNKITYGRFSAFTGAATVTAWKAALWPAGGSAAVMIADPKDEKSCQEVREYFTVLSKTPINGIAAVIGNEELRRRGAFPNACALIEMEPGTQIGPAAEGHASIPLKPKEGQNGYYPELPDMFAAFFLAGKGIAPGQNLGDIDMRQVAPTLAAILGVDLPTADYKPIALK